MPTNLYEPLVVVSRAITEADTNTTAQLIDVPAKTLVTSVHLVVTEAFAGGTPLLDIGDGADADGWIDQTECDATTIGGYLGVAAVYAVNPKYYAAADTIDAVVSASLTDGTAYVVARMVRLDEVV